MGSLRISFFSTEGLCGYSREPNSTFPKVPGRTYLPNRSKIIPLAAARLVLTSFVRDQTQQYTYIYIYIYIHSSLIIYMVYMLYVIYIYIYKCVCIYIYICIYMCVYMYIYIYVCVYIYIYIYTRKVDIHCEEPRDCIFNQWNEWSRPLYHIVYYMFICLYYICTLSIYYMFAISYNVIYNHPDIISIYNHPNI